MAGQGAGMSGTGPPSEPPGDYAGPFAVERDRLTELLAGVQAADWDRPSPCPGWTVLGLCCHLVGDDLGLLARNRDGFLGTRAPAGSEAEFAAWLDELQAEWVRARTCARVPRRCPGRGRTWCRPGSARPASCRSTGSTGSRSSRRWAVPVTCAPTSPGRCSTRCAGLTPTAWPARRRGPATPCRSRLPARSPGPGTWSPPRPDGSSVTSPAPVL